MRRIIIICLAVLFAFTITVNTIAGDNNFTASITAKSAPESVLVSVGEYKNCEALVKDENNNIINGLSDKEVEVVALKDAETITSKEEKQALIEAFDEIKKADSVGSLANDFSSYAKKVYPNIDMNKYIVKDLFHVAVPDEINIMLEKGAAYVEIRFNEGLTKGDNVFVLVKCPDEDWHTVDPDNVVINSDGTISVSFDRFCPVAFVVADPAAVAAAAMDEPSVLAETEPTQPDKSDNSGNKMPIIYTAIGVSAAVILLVVVIVVFKKKSHRD